jgi:thimet oligopeptidase
VSFRHLCATALLAGCASTPLATAPTAAVDRATPLPPPDGEKPLLGTPAELRATCTQAVADANALIQRLKAMPAPRGTLAALSLYDDANERLDDTGGMAAIAENSHPEAAMREAAQACEQQLDQASKAILLDGAVYAVLQSLDLSGQDDATRYYVFVILRDFRRTGVDKDEATRTKIKALNDEILTTGLLFDKTIRDDVRSISVAPSELAGLPDDYVRSHAAGADGKVRITTDYPDIQPFMAYARSGSAREALWKTNLERGYPKNVDTLAKLVQLRTELATLLGFSSWAAYETANKMVRTDAAAGAFIDKISGASGSRMESDYRELLERKQKDQPSATSVNPWEAAYYTDRVKAERYAFDARQMRPYFEYARVKQGVFDITSKLFGVRYVARPEVKTWAPGIEAYDVFDLDGAPVGRFYLDMHPRPNKYKHAAEWGLVEGQAGRRLPEAVLMCNFPAPGAEPALMEHAQVVTFFHEFGHLLHHLFSGRVQWAGLSGTRTEQDFVEAPSQLLEEWTRDYESLRTFAKDYKTGDVIPKELVQQMRHADSFSRGMGVRQQMFYAAYSLDLYENQGWAKDSTALVKKTMEQFTPFHYVPGTYFQASFGHLNGYSAIYYTYMWSLVIAKDLYTPFQSTGVFNTETAGRYRRTVLNPGGSKPAAELVKDFLGRDYSFDAYSAWLNRTE